ncbi:MAG TPA: hypothetical protein VGM98_10665 [Schlesneria sp.]
MAAPKLRRPVKLSEMFPDARPMAAMNKLKDSGLCQWTSTTPGPQGGRPTHRMEVIKQRKVTSDEKKGTASSKQPAEPSTQSTVSRSPAEVVSNTEERIVTTGRPHSV